MSKSHILTAILFLLSFAAGSAQTEESDSLFAAGVAFYQDGKYGEAIPFFAQCDSIDKATLPEGSNRRDYSVIWLASCYYQLGDTIKAEETHKYYAYAPVDRRLTVESDSLGALGLVTHNSNGDLENALTYFEQCAEIEKAVVGEDHIWYLNTLSTIDILYFKLAEKNASLGNYAEAIRLGTEALKIREKVHGREHPNYATSLSNLARYNSSLGNYAEAIRLGTEALKIREKVHGREHPNYATSLSNLARYNSSLGNYAEAIRLGTEALKIREKVHGKEHPNYARSLNNLANYNYYLGNYAEAIRLGTEAMKIWERVLGKEHPDYATSLNNLASYNSNLGNYAEAIRLGTEAMNIRERVLGKEHPDYALSLNNLANYNSYLGNYAEAIRLGTEAMNIRERVLGKEHPDYALSLNNLARYNSSLGNYTEAIEYGEEARTIYLESSSKKSSGYASTLSCLAACNFYLGNYTEAIEYGEEARTIYLESSNKKSSGYASTLSCLALSNFCLGNYKEAVKRGTEAIDIYQKRSGNKSSQYAETLNCLAACNFYLGNYDEAVKFGTDAMMLREEVSGKRSAEYAETLHDLSRYYAEVGSYLKAYRLGTEAKNICLELGKKDSDYATFLCSLASYAAKLGRYEEALSLGNEAIKIYEETLGKNHPYYATALSNLAGFYSHLEKQEEAIRLATEAMNIYAETLGKKNTGYAYALSNLSYYYWELNKQEEAIGFAAEAMNIYVETLGKKNTGYAYALNRLGFYNFSLGNYEKAVDAEAEAMTIHQEVSGKESYDYALSLSNLAFYNGMLRNDSMLEYYASAYTLSAAKNIRSIFASVNAQTRMLYWQKFRDGFELWPHLYARCLPSDTLSANGYNAVLLSKGLLLNSEIEFTKLIQESGDEEALGLFKDLQARRIQINKLIEKPIAERPLDVDSLSREADKVEQELVDRSKVYGDFTKNLVITWPQVQEKLGDKDAAVEFVSFPWTADSTMYIAYVLRKDWACPRMIPLFEEKELEAIGGYDYYTTPSLSHLVWEPLEEALEGADRVYFSPGGDLYNIAIESVPDHLNPAHIVSDRRDYYRLSSTRELALIQDDYTWTEGAVYGGLDYNMGVGSLAADEAHYAQSSSEGQGKRGIDLSYYYLGGEDFAEGIRSDRKSSGLLDSLPGTREEAVAIKAQLDDISVPSSLYTDDLGTEASFKALDGQRTSIIHIGTHGFFNTKKAEYKDPSSLLMTSSQQTVRVEDDALSRSGLCMAGANNLLSRTEALPDSLDDGWLTALEIAHLDLRGLDMVVLSACKTGVGEVTGDGVFGLQRGFKKAGARTLVMSLWNVPDQLTCYFMKEFFARISVDKNGHPTNKHAAFLQAQQAARTHWQEVDPHAAPYDWAAFILLDGVR